jgi:type I restriction enzyme S subunit
MSNKIPKGWKWVKLGEIADVRDGTHDSPKETIDGKYLITSKHIKNGKIDFSKAYKISLDDFEAINKRSKVDKYDILFSMIGTIGEMVIVDFEPDFAIKNVGLFKTRNKDLSIWIYYYLKSNDAQAEIRASLKGSTQQYITLGDLRNFPILLPPLPEQKAIAEVLSSIDDKIDLLHRQNKTLEEMAMTLFRQWFIEPTKDGLPEGWEEVSLGDSDLSKIIPSGIKKFEGFKTYLATGDVESTLIKGGVEITYNNRPSRANMQPEKYSVWFAKKEGVRKLLMFDDYSNIDKYILSTGFTGLKTTELSHYYIWCFILHEDFQDIKDSLVSGSVQPDIPNEAVLQIFIPRPPNEVLLSFNEKVKPLFTKIQFNNFQIQTLEKLRDTLLPKLISGELRVKL